MSDDSRRFTDREVAIVLKKAAEIDETEGTGAAGGLSIADLMEIAKSVGISPASIEKAARGLEAKSPASSLIAGPPLVRRSVHAVSGELNQEAIARLIRLIDERTDAAGSVTEALGSVRWTSGERFKSTQIDITPKSGETRIQVVEKMAPRLRRVLYLVPASWGLMFAPYFMGRVESASAIAAVAIATIGAGAGAAIGRAILALKSARSAQRVERLAADIAFEAYEASKSGLLAPAAADQAE